MKRSLICVVVLWFMIWWVSLAAAAEGGSDQGPWEKYGLSVGAFFSSTSTGVRLGSGIGIDLDMEELLGLDASNTVFRVDGLWRFSENRRHRVDLSWFSLRRDGSNHVGEDFTLELPDGDVINIPAGTKIESTFNLDIYEAAYSYSFFQDDRLDLAALIGLYVMPIDFSLKATGLVEAKGSEDFTAPLPVAGLRADVAITPQWFLRTGTQFFYLEYEQFTGSLLEARVAVEYNPWEHVGFGLGIDALRFSLEADGEDYPSIDLVGKVNFNYTGLQLYMRVFF